jgi:YbgC/YbaW family acyl-CoA thioester hydrolase
MMGRGGQEVSVPVTVEFEDVDSYGIAHHTRLVTFLERARLRLLTSLGAELSGIAPVVYEIHVRFRKPARLMDQLTVTARVRGHDEYTLALEYEISREGEAIVKARSVIAFADLEGGTLATLPGELVNALRSASGDGDAEERPERRLTD